LKLKYVNILPPGPGERSVDLSGGC
jgi:hypothetical protein